MCAAIPSSRFLRRPCHSKRSTEDWNWAENASSALDCPAEEHKPERPFFARYKKKPAVLSQALSFQSHGVFDRQAGPAHQEDQCAHTNLACIKIVASLPMAVCVSGIYDPLKLFTGEVICRHALFFDTFHPCGGILFEPIIRDTEIEEAHQAFVLAPGRIRPVAQEARNLVSSGVVSSVSSVRPRSTAQLSN